jgi:DNA-binding NtrC family response regulator
MLKKSCNSQQILIIDDDEAYCSLLKNSIEIELDLKTDCFASLSHLGSVGSLSRYSLFILDYFLDKMTGVEIAEYLDALLPGKPSLIISASNQLHRMHKKLPKSVRAVIPKSAGISSIMEAIRSLEVTS